MRFGSAFSFLILLMILAANSSGVCAEINCDDRFGCRPSDGGSSSGWSGGTEKNYIEIGVNGRGPYNNLPEDGYVNLRWTCPNFKNLGGEVLDRTVLGKLFGDYSGSYALKITLTGAKNNKIETVLASFQYDKNKATAATYCDALILKMNLNTTLQMQIDVLRSSQIGINTNISGAVAALGKIGGVVLSGPSAFLLNWFNDASGALTQAQASKDQLNAYLANFNTTVASSSSITVTPDIQNLKFTIDGNQYVLSKINYSQSAVYRSAPSLASDFEKALLQNTTLDLDKIRSSISETFEKDMANPSNFDDRCLSYQKKLGDLGLTSSDVSLLMWEELNGIRFPKDKAPGLCLTGRQILTLKQFPAFAKTPPYQGGYGDVIAGQ